MSNLALSKKFLIGIVIAVVLAAPILALAQAQTQQQDQTQQDKNLEEEISKTLKEIKEQSCGLDVFCHLGKFVRWASLQFGYIIGYIAAAFISLATSLIQTLIAISSTLTESPLVQTGFKITLNLANLGFVLVIIWIAFATILRVFSYELKKAIPNLIVAAVLVNFSFAIAGILIDFSNITGLFFLNAAAPDNIIAFGDNLAYSLNTSELANFEFKNSAQLSGLLDFGKEFLSAIASVILTVIFSITLVITFFAVAFMLLIRYIALTFLLILMPLAWVAWVIPELAGLWKEWWNTFFRWVFFLPAMMMFIYLSIFSNQKIGAILQAHSKNLPSTQATEKLFNKPAQSIVAILQIIVQIGLLTGGLIVANKFGIRGAETALELAKKGRKLVLGKAGKLGKTAVRATARAATRRPLKAAAHALSNVLNMRGIRWIPGAKRAMAALAGYAARRSEVEEYEKKYLDNLTSAQFGHRLATTKPQPKLKPIETAAYISQAIKRGELDKIKPEDLPAYVEALKRTNPGTKTEDIPEVKQILESSPLLAPTILGLKGDAAVEKVREIANKMRPDQAAKLKAKDFRLDRADPNSPRNKLVKALVLGMSLSATASFLRNASEEDRKAYEDAVKAIASPPELEELYQQWEQADNEVKQLTKKGEDAKAAKQKAEELARRFFEEEKRLGAAAAGERLRWIQQNIANQFTS